MSRADREDEIRREERRKIADELEAEAAILDASKGRLERGQTLREFASRLRSR